MLFNRNFLVLILLFLTLSGCTDFKHVLGYDEPVLDFPPGEYIGTAKLLVEGEEDEEALVEEEAPVQKEETKVPEAKAKGTTNGKALTNGQVATETSAEETIPQSIKFNKNLKPVKLTFLSKAPSIRDGVGVLTLENSSQRFYWRSDGNNHDTWNLLFAKDNNVYSNLKNNFSFDGVVKSSEMENSIEGKLHVDYDENISDYYIEAFQFFNPEIFPPKDTLSGVGGTNIDITVSKIGDDPELIKVLMISKLDKENQKVLEVASVKPGKQTDQKIMSLVLEKGVEKGDYWLSLVRTGRDREFKSNKIPLSIGK